MVESKVLASCSAESTYQAADATRRVGIRAATVIVCTRNRPRELESCLAALAMQICTDFEVLVIDNGSVPPVADICARWGACYVREPKAGLCIARNAGARHATGEIIAYLDDDAVPEAVWLETLLEGFADPAVAVVAGRIRYMKALGDSRGMSAEEALDANVARPRRVFGRGSRNWFALACFGGIGDGSNMAFRRKEFFASPGFDERLGRGRLLEGGDEHVLFMSFLALGHCIAYVPEAVVRHPYPSAPGLVRVARIRERRTAIAHLGFLWGEFPARRLDILRHLASAVIKRLRPGPASSNETTCLTYAQALQAGLSGLSLYRDARREWATISKPSYRGLAPARRTS